jgi:uncharacterized lipoprotein YddW (UPF0748 family)
MYLRGDLKDKKLKRDFRLMHKSGIDGLLIIEPNISDAEFEHIAGIANDEGLRVHVWIPTTNPHGKRGVEKEHPEWYQVSREGKSCLDAPPYVGYYKWLCPNNPGAREYIKGIMKELAQKDFLDGVHLDYIRYPDVILPVGIQPKYDLVQDKEFPEYDFCYCDVCRTKFKAEFGIDPMEIDDPAGNKDWLEFRYNSITNLVNEIYDVVHEEGKMLSAAVFPTPTLAKKLVRQDWVNWKIDALMPMIYHEYYYEPLEWVETATQEGVDALNGKTKFYSGVFTGWIEAEEMSDLVKYSRGGGANGICLFTANGMSKKQWKKLGKALKKK